MLIQCRQQQPMLDVVEQTLDVKLQNPVPLAARYRTTRYLSALFQQRLRVISTASSADFPGR
jgi:hypothetical protein